MSYINMASVKKKISKSERLINQTEKIVKNRFEAAQSRYLNEFESHPVTKEIEAGPKSSNLSSTLGGVGNLFSFIGFNSADNPVQSIRNYIKSNFKLGKPKILSRGGKIRLDFEVSYPSLEDLKNISPMPWEGGRSWVSSIERGISGFSNYIYKRFIEGRSGEALQSKNKVRGNVYKPTKYMSMIIENFIKGIKK